MYLPLQARHRLFVQLPHKLIAFSLDVVPYAGQFRSALPPTSDQTWQHYVGRFRIDFDIAG